MTLITNTKQLEDIIILVINSTMKHVNYVIDLEEDAIKDSKQEIIKYFNLPDLFTNENNSN